MNFEEYEKFSKAVARPVVSVEVSELKDKSDRTLLYGYYGYKENSHGFHVYICEGMIFSYSFYREKYFDANAANSIELDDFRLSSWVHPQLVDLEFAEVLRSKGVELNFLGFDQDVKMHSYYKPLGAMAELA